MNDNKIEIRNLYKAFGKKKVLDGVDLDIKKGESLVVIGGSGTGKSVLIKCIQGLLTPDCGSIKIDDEETIGSKKDIHEKMGMLFQGAALFDSLSVWENVAFRLLQDGKKSRKQAKVTAIRVLRQVGLAPDVADLSPAELSGGMQKRVGLARAIISRPEIIFFDDMASARKIADRIAMLYKGKIIWSGTVKEMDKSENPYLQQFIHGSSQGPIKMEV